MKLNPENDVKIDVANLDDEFRKISVLFFRYSESKAEAQGDADLEEAKYKELRAKVYKDLKSHDTKWTEKAIEASIEDDKAVKKQKRKMLEAKYNLEIVKGYMESLRTKKDMLIQLGSDRRKEV